MGKVLKKLCSTLMYLVNPIKKMYPSFLFTLYILWWVNLVVKCSEIRVNKVFSLSFIQVFFCKTSSF